MTAREQLAAGVMVSGNFCNGTQAYAYGDFIETLGILSRFFV
jgi:hypothetical protein